jgi:hypothetical protein
MALDAWFASVSQTASCWNGVQWLSDDITTMVDSNQQHVGIDHVDDAKAQLGRLL